MPDQVREVQMRRWEEIVGVFQALEKGDLEACIVIGNLRAVFPADSPEAKTPLKTIKEDWIGQKIGLLGTDNPEKPAITRHFNENTDSNQNLIHLQKNVRMNPRSFEQIRQDPRIDHNLEE